jgi:hypothetical protein
MCAAGASYVQSALLPHLNAPLSTIAGCVPVLYAGCGSVIRHATHPLMERDAACLQPGGNSLPGVSTRSCCTRCVLLLAPGLTTAACASCLHVGTAAVAHIGLWLLWLDCCLMLWCPHVTCSAAALGCVTVLYPVQLKAPACSPFQLKTLPSRLVVFMPECMTPKATNTQPRGWCCCCCLGVDSRFVLPPGHQHVTCHQQHLLTCSISCSCSSALCRPAHSCCARLLQLWLDPGLPYDMLASCPCPLAPKPPVLTQPMHDRQLVPAVWRPLLLLVQWRPAL